jgi:hypothetical protein
LLSNNDNGECLKAILKNMVWDHISARVAFDGRMVWDSKGAKMVEVM